MSTPDEEPPVFLDATVPPLCAALIVRDFPGFLRELESRGRNLVIAGQEVYGRQVLRGAGTIRKVGLDRLAANKSSGIGTPAVPIVPADASSDLLLGFRGVLAREAATRLHLQVRRVTQMCERGELMAAKSGGRWFIDEVSLAEEIDRRVRKT